MNTLFTLYLVVVTGMTGEVYELDYNLLYEDCRATEQVVAAILPHFDTSAYDEVYTTCKAQE